MKRDVIIAFPPVSELKSMKPINLDGEEFDSSLEHLKDLEAQYADIFISSRNKILEYKRAFFSGLIIALILNVFVLFLSRYLPKNQYSFVGELILVIILLGVLLYQIKNQLKHSKICEEDIKLFEDSKDIDWEKIIKDLRSKENFGDEYVKRFIPYAIKTKKESIRKKSHYK